MKSTLLAKCVSIIYLINAKRLSSVFATANITQCSYVHEREKTNVCLSVWQLRLIFGTRAPQKFIFACLNADDTRLNIKDGIFYRVNTKVGDLS